MACAEAMRAAARWRCKGRGDLPRQGRRTRFSHSPPRHQRSIFPGPDRFDQPSPMTQPELEHDYSDIRDAVAKLCAQFPGEYWRKLDREMAYPTDFVDALTRGRLSLGADPGGVWRRRAEAVGRGRDPGRDPARRLQWRRLPRPDVHHGHACCGTAATSRRRNGCRRSPAANCACRRSASPSRPAAPIPRR